MPSFHYDEAAAETPERHGSGIEFALASPSAASVSPHTPATPQPQSNGFLQEGKRHRNKSVSIESGETVAKTVYLTAAENEMIDIIAMKMKHSRKLKGQVGFSLALRVGIALLTEAADEDMRRILQIASQLKKTGIRVGRG